jgi:hypothetical protein
MADRPEPFMQLGRYFAAARIAHEYIADIFRELEILLSGRFGSL